ncbi:MAG: copper resistance protein CopC [Actinomycetota bacterium]
MLSRVARRAAPAIVGGALIAGATAGVASAHDANVVATPASGSTIDQPIDEVTLTFDTTIGQDVEIALLDPDEEEIGTTSTRISDFAAKAEFEPLDEEGTYIIRYLMTAAEDGHLLVGAVQFNLGDAGSSNATLWVAFGIAAVAILGVGGWFSLRNHRRAATAGDSPGDVDNDLSDVGV